MYSEMEIKIANATSRTNGASAKNKDGSVRAIVPRYISENVDKNVDILDYGAGKGATHTLWLRELGFKNVTAYDFGSNCIEGLHNKDALSKQYKVIFASNVLNVQSSMLMMLETLRQINNSLEPGGEFIANYPASPRKMLLSAADIENILCEIFGCYPERVGGTKSAPMWRIVKWNN